MRVRACLLVRNNSFRESSAATNGFHSAFQLEAVKEELTPGEVYLHAKHATLRSESEQHMPSFLSQDYPAASEELGYLSFNQTAPSDIFLRTEVPPTTTNGSSVAEGGQSKALRTAYQSSFPVNPPNSTLVVSTGSSPETTSTALASSASKSASTLMTSSGPMLSTFINEPAPSDIFLSTESRGKRSREFSITQIRKSKSSRRRRTTKPKSKPSILVQNIVKSRSLNWGETSVTLPKEVLLNITSSEFDEYAEWCKSQQNLTEEEINELRRQKRQIKNREAAHASRQRKKDMVTKMQANIEMVNDENSSLKEEVAALKAENTALKSQIADLTRLLGGAALLRQKFEDPD